MDALPSPADHRHGLTPIIATVVLTAMVLSLAISAMTFLQGQQSSIGEQLQEALDDDVIIEETTCNGKQIRFRIANNGDEPLSTGTAEIVVFEDGNINYSFATDTVVLNGSFREPDQTGYLNISTDAVFRSGRQYTVQLNFGEFRLDRRCVAGQEWWNINWNNRRQIVVTNTEDTTKDDAIAAVTFNTSDHIIRGRMNPDCSDIAIVEDGRRRAHSLDSCDDMDGSTIRFRTDVNRSDTEYDTYIYYSNLRTQNQEEGLGQPDSAIETVLRPEEER